MSDGAILPTEKRAYSLQGWSFCSPSCGGREGSRASVCSIHHRVVFRCMRTNIDLDDELVKRGLKLSGLRTKKELVDVALREFLRRKDQKKILELRNKISWKGDLNLMRRNRF